MPSDPPSPLLEVSRLSKRFGRVQAVRGVSFALAAGEIVALAGGDGSGKTTLAKLIAGLYEPDSGELRYFGQANLYPGARAASDAGIEIVSQDQVLVYDRAADRRRAEGRILILDEPASALDARARERLAALVRAAKERGCGVLFVSRDVEDIFAVADRIIVLRHGAVVGERRADATDPGEVARLMEG